MGFLATILKVLSAPGKDYLVKQYAISFGLMALYIISNSINERDALLTSTYLSILFVNSLLLPYSLFFLRLITGYISSFFRSINFTFATNVPIFMKFIPYLIAFGFAMIFAPMSLIFIYFTKVRAVSGSNI